MTTSPTLIFFITAIIMLTFFMLVQTHIMQMVQLFFLQNVLLIITMICKGGVHAGIEFYLSLTVALIIKVVIIPAALWKLVNNLKLYQHVDPLLSKSMLQLIGILLVVFVLLLSHQIEPVIHAKMFAGFSLLLANCMLALLIVIFRRKAISQVIGLLVLENSIFILSFTLTSGFPWIIELSIGFDIMMGFMIFGLFLLRIRNMYGSLQLQHLEKLKERF